MQYYPGQTRYHSDAHIGDSRFYLKISPKKKSDEGEDDSIPHDSAYEARPNSHFSPLIQNRRYPTQSGELKDHKWHSGDDGRHTGEDGGKEGNDCSEKSSKGGR